MTALLHDVVEDTPYKLQQMPLEFGSEVANIVDHVTDLYRGHFPKFKMSKMQVLSALMAKENDKALLVKTADFVHNMCTIMGHPLPSKRRQIAMCGRNFFIPIAQGLGLKGVSTELQDRCDAVLNDSRATNDRAVIGQRGV